MPQAIPLIVGAGVKYYGQRQADQGAQAAAAAGLAKQVADRSRAMGLVDTNTGQIASDTPEARTAQAQDDYMAALRGGAGNTAASYPTVAGANPRYAEAVKAAGDQATDFATKRAALMAGLRGQQRMRGDEALRAETEGTNLTGIGQDAGTDAAITGLNIKKAGQVNPAYELAGNLISNSGAAFSPTGAASMVRPGSAIPYTPGSSAFGSAGNSLGSFFGNDPSQVFGANPFNGVQYMAAR